MSLTGYIVEKYNNMSNSYTCKRLIEEAKAEGIDLCTLGVYDTLISQEKPVNVEKRLQDCDFVINRYKWGAIKDILNTLAIKSYNSLDAFNVYVNKFEQVKRLFSSSYKIPRYCLGIATLPYTKITECLGTPFVAKGLESSMGEEVFLIENELQYIGLEKTWGKGKEWLFEEYIAFSYGRDIRFYSIRGNVVACMQRKSQGDFRANVALGATVEPYSISEWIRQCAMDIYTQTGLDFLGIDLLFGEDKPYFCEINVMPGIEGIEKASGVNVARKIIETIKGDFE